MDPAQLGALTVTAASEPLRLLDAVAATPQALAVTRGEGHTISFVNAAWSALLGPLELGAPALAVLPAPARPVLRAALARAYGDGHQVVVRIPTGDARLFELVVTPLHTATGRRYGLLLTAVPPQPAPDALHAHHRRHSAVLSHAAVVRWVWTADGACTQPGVGWAELTGQSAQAAAGNGWLDAVDPRDRDAVAASWALARQRGEPWEVTLRVLDRAGAPAVLRALAVPLRDGQGTLQEWAGAAFPVEPSAEATEPAASLGFDVILVPQLPALDEVEVALSVFPGRDSPAGSFSEVVDLGTGHVVLAVGQVLTGNAPTVLAARVQSVLRSAVLLGLTPQRVLSVVRSALAAAAPAAQVALLVASHDSPGRLLTVANAGVPTALARWANGEVALLADDGQPPLGLAGETPVERHYGFAPGSLLALPSPGLVARLGVKELARAVAGAAGPAGLGERVVELVGGAQADTESVLLTLLSRAAERAPDWSVQRDLAAGMAEPQATAAVSELLAELAGVPGGRAALADTVGVAAAAMQADGAPPLRLRLRSLPGGPDAAALLHVELADTVPHDVAAGSAAPFSGTAARRSGVRAGVAGRVAWAEFPLG